MARGKRRKLRGVGRPPAGARAGERVKDYPQLSVRVPREIKVTLGALSVLRAKPQWRIVVESIECLIGSLPDADRQSVQELIKRHR